MKENPSDECTEEGRLDGWDQTIGIVVHRLARAWRSGIWDMCKYAMIYYGCVIAKGLVVFWDKLDNSCVCLETYAC